MQRQCKIFETSSQKLFQSFVYEYFKKFSWNTEHQIIIDLLFHHLTTPPILRCPDFEKPIKLDLDALREGLGCALYQAQGKKSEILGSGSRTLVGAEQKYHRSKLEFLILNWTICDHFRDYVYHEEHFDVYTDLIY